MATLSPVTTVRATAQTAGQALQEVDLATRALDVVTQSGALPSGVRLSNGSTVRAPSVLNLPAVTSASVPSPGTPGGIPSLGGREGAIIHTPGAVSGTTVVTSSEGVGTLGNARIVPQPTQQLPVLSSAQLPALAPSRLSLPRRTAVLPSRTGVITAVAPPSPTRFVSPPSPTRFVAPPSPTRASAQNIANLPTRTTDLSPTVAVNAPNFTTATGNQRTSTFPGTGDSQLPAQAVITPGVVAAPLTAPVVTTNTLQAMSPANIGQVLSAPRVLTQQPQVQPQVLSAPLLGQPVVQTPVLTPANTPRVLSAPMDAKVLSPLPSARFSNYSSAVDSNNIDDLLMKKGYTALQYITLDNEDQVAYIKAENPIGDIVIIKADKAGLINVQLPNRTVVKVSDGSQVPKSVKVSAATCAGSASCGVAFECEGDYCIMNRNNDGSLSTGTYALSETVVNRTLTPFGSPVAYPVITLSEIEANNEAAIVTARKATETIQNESRKATRDLFSNLIQQSAGTTFQLQQVNTALDNFHNAIAGERKTYLAMADRYRSLPQPLSSQNQENYKQIVDHLFKLNKTFDKLQRFTYQYHGQLLPAVQTQTTQALDAFNELYVKARKTLDPGVSGWLLKAGLWGLPPQLNAVPSADLMKGDLGTTPLTPSVQSLGRVLKTPGLSLD